MHALKILGWIILWWFGIAFTVTGIWTAFCLWMKPPHVEECYHLPSVPIQGAPITCQLCGRVLGRAR